MYRPYHSDVTSCLIFFRVSKYLLSPGVFFTLLIDWLIDWFVLCLTYKLDGSKRLYGHACLIILYKYIIYYYLCIVSLPPSLFTFQPIHYSHRIAEQKWNKSKSKEKLNSKVLFDEDLYSRFMTEVPKMKVITPSALVEKFKVNVSLARAALRQLLGEGKIEVVDVHNNQQIYTKVGGAK